MTEQTLDAFDGRIDILVNNAGICYHAPSFDVTDQQWADVFDLNVRALWKTSLAVGAGMRDRGSGSIVNIGSMSGIIVNRPQWQPAYNASKAAVHHLTKSLAVEWAPYGIRVNAVAPGYVKTEMAPVDRPEFQRYWVEDAPSNASRSPRRSPPASSSSPATPHPSSPARSWWPTAATPRSKSGVSGARQSSSRRQFHRRHQHRAGRPARARSQRGAGAQHAWWESAARTCTPPTAAIRSSTCRCGPGMRWSVSSPRSVTDVDEGLIGTRVVVEPNLACGHCPSAQVAVTTSVPTSRCSVARRPAG